jgi:hypothetical protein
VPRDGRRGTIPDLEKHVCLLIHARSHCDRTPEIGMRT